MPVTDTFSIIVKNLDKPVYVFQMQIIPATTIIHLNQK